MENIEAALKEAERVCKKQRVCAVKTAECLDLLIAEISNAQQQLCSEADGAAIMQDLAQCLSRPDALKDLSDSTKDLHSAVNKLGKVCDTSNTCFGKLDRAYAISPKTGLQQQNACVRSGERFMTALSILLQAVDKAFLADICAASRPVEFDQASLNQASSTVRPLPWTLLQGSCCLPST